MTASTALKEAGGGGVGALKVKTTSMSRHVRVFYPFVGIKERGTKDLVVVWGRNGGPEGVKKKVRKEL